MLHRQALAGGTGKRFCRLDEPKWDAEASAAMAFLKVYNVAKGVDRPEDLDLEGVDAARFIDGDYAQALENFVSQAAVLREDQIHWHDGELAKDLGWKDPSEQRVDPVVVEQRIVESVARSEHESGA